MVLLLGCSAGPSRSPQILQQLSVLHEVIPEKKFTESSLDRQLDNFDSEYIAMSPYGTISSCLPKL